MDYINIFIFIVFIILVYSIYSWFFGSSSTTLSRFHDATQELKINPQALAGNGGGTSSFTFSICYFLDDWNHRFGEEKIIFQRKSRDTCNDKPCLAPKVAFDRYKNNIIITLATIGNAGSTQPDIVIIENVPLQKWANIIVSVAGRAMDIYLDGKLIQTKLLSNAPNMAATSELSLTPDGGFSGSTADFSYYEHSLNPREAYNKYKEGCGNSSWLGGLLNRYRLKMAFLKDNKEMNSFEI